MPTVGVGRAPRRIVIGPQSDSHPSIPRRRRLAPFAAALVAAATLLAGAPAATAAPGSAAPGCGPLSCTFTRTGQSLFRVPAGVTLLQVDVVGAGGKPGAAAPKKGDALEVQGNLALASGVTTLEVVVGGKDTLGGTTSEIMTSTDATSQVLVAAAGVPVPPTPAAKKSAASEKAAAAKKPSAATKPAAASPPALTSIPTGGTATAATRPARVVIRWRAPGQAPAFVPTHLPVIKAGTSSELVVQAVAPTVPTLTEHGSLPLGLSFHDQGNGTAAFEGVPLADGVYRVRVIASAGVASVATRHLRLVVRGGLVRLG